MISPQLERLCMHSGNDHGMHKDLHTWLGWYEGRGNILENKNILFWNWQIVLIKNLW